MDRRQFLSFLGVGSAFAVAPHMAFAAAATDRRFVFVIQRGAADGLETLVPYADPAYATLRGKIALDPAALIKLDGTFGLNPALPQIGAMYRGGEVAFFHAIASPYRDRSHFDGQNVLESGGEKPYEVHDGWLNRLAGLLPKPRDQAIAFAPTVPLALRGPLPATSYAPSPLPEVPDDLLMRIDQMYDSDPQLHALWNAAAMAKDVAGDAGPKQDPVTMGSMAADFLKLPNGPRIAMIETGGWDTHVGQNGRLKVQLGALDRMLGALKAGLGKDWAFTTVLVATEFGRTAAANGTGGTDHGTATSAMLVGGAVKGGRIVTDWPGLGQAALYQQRDLKPTAELDTLIAGAAGESLGIEPGLVGRKVFERELKPMSGLIRT